MNIILPVNSEFFPKSTTFFAKFHYLSLKAEIFNVYLLMGRNFQKVKYYVKYYMGHHQTIVALPLIRTLLSICTLVQPQAWLPLAILPTVFTWGQYSGVHGHLSALTYSERLFIAFTSKNSFTSTPSREWKMGIYSLTLISHQ